MEERKFVCKYCYKRFPCGKSLGGHIRTHMTEERNNNAAAVAAAAAAAAAVDSDTLKYDGAMRKKRDFSWSESEAAVGVHGNINSNSSFYGLRENPKKTMRFVYSNAATASAATAVTLEQEEKFCKECGKGFPSLKALCGHMACHSDKEKRIINNKFEDDDSVMDSTQSDTDTCGGAQITHPRRSKRKLRFKSLPIANQPSSSVSEVEEMEQEEVAMCLMLLSRDSSHKGRFASESSDNNSVVLETKSPSFDTRVANRNGNNNNNKFVSNVSNNSDSRHFRSYGSNSKTADSDVSNYGFKRPKVEEDKSGLEDFRSKCSNVSVVKKLRVKDLVDDRRDNESTRKFDYRKRSNYDTIVDDKLVGNGKLANDLSTSNEMYDNVSYDSTEEESDGENSSESDSFPAPKSHNSSKVVSRKKSSKGKKKKLKSKKSKEHECPICFRIFKSGQALGGHKRSHFIGGSEENTLFIKQIATPTATTATPNSTTAPCLKFDLNLPAPFDE